MKDLGPRTRTGLLYGAGALAAALAPWPVFAAVVLAVGIVAASELLALRRAGAAAVAEGVLLVAGLAALLWLRSIGSGAVVFVLLATWAADVGAYVVGSKLGSRRIAPRISPGKTWEGTIGGFAAAGLVVLVVGLGAGDPDAAASAWLLAGLIGPAAFAGDLLESYVKRRAGVKDSGTLFPGHGGLLDRIDSVLAVAVVAVAVTAPRL